jgi:AcrR family transcriptional regulator
MSPRGQMQNQEMRTRALERITAAAYAVFCDYGYHGATMKQITKATGLSYGLVYHYFPSKEQLFLHVVDIALDKSISALECGLDTPGTAWERLSNLSAHLLKSALDAESAKYYVIMQQAITQGRSIPGLLDQIERRSATHYEAILPVIIQAQQSGDAAQDDPVALAAAYFSFVQGLTLLVDRDPEIEKKLSPEILTGILRNRDRNR